MEKKLFQGDVAYIKITEEQLNKLLNGKEFEDKKITGSHTIVHGESGNSHRIVIDKPDTLVELMDMGNGMFALKVKGEAITTHEKHLPAKKLKTGIYFIARKTEYDPREEKLVRD